MERGRPPSPHPSFHPFINKPEHCIYEVKGAYERKGKKGSLVRNANGERQKKKVDGRLKGQRNGGTDDGRRRAVVLCRNALSGRGGRGQVESGRTHLSFVDGVLYRRCKNYAEQDFYVRKRNIQSQTSGPFITHRMMELHRVVTTKLVQPMSNLHGTATATCILSYGLC